MQRVCFKKNLPKKSVKMKKNNIAAFFDLDHTLINKNTGIVWGWMLIKKGKMPVMFFINAAFFGLLYEMKLYSFRQLMKRLFKTMKGRNASEILKLTNSYFKGNKDYLLRPKMLQRIGWHKAQGHRIIIITQTFDFIAKIFAKDIGASKVYSTEVGIKEGKFTGEVKPQIGEEKDDLMRAVSPLLGIDLKKSYAYTDSTRDLEMLEAVGKPQVVYPSSRLKAVAKKRNWQIWDSKQKIFKQD